MREVYKNPMLYYLLIPVLVGLWPLLVWGIYLPRSQDDLDSEIKLYGDGYNCVTEILRIDPDRPSMQSKGQGTREFSFGPAVEQAANLCKIPSSSYILNTGTLSTSEGRKRQDARVKLTNVGIVQATKFLSNMQSMWVTLQCQDVKFQRKKGMPDQWDVDFRFLYYY
jgi:hypothetical protein